MSTTNDEDVATTEATRTTSGAMPEAVAAPKMPGSRVRSAIAEPLTAANDDEDEDDGAEATNLEDDDEAETFDEEEEGEGIVITLNADLRRRLRRRAEREGVEPEELAEELLTAAIRRPVTQSLVDVLARLDKLERRVSDMAAARPVAEQGAAPPPRREERPRNDYGRGGFGERRYERGGFGGGDRGYAPRPPSGGYRGERRFDDRPRGGYGDRGSDRGERSYDRGGEREGYRERPGRHWEAPRRGE